MRHVFDWRRQNRRLAASCWLERSGHEGLAEHGGLKLEEPVEDPQDSQGNLDAAGGDPSIRPLRQLPRCADVRW